MQYTWKQYKTLDEGAAFYMPANLRRVDLEKCLYKIDDNTAFCVDTCDVVTMNPIRIVATEGTNEKT